MEETTMVKTWGFRTQELNVAGLASPDLPESMVRLYRDSLATASLQIRHLGPTNRSGLGKPKMMIASAILTIEEMKERAAKLNEMVVAAEKYAATGVPTL